MAPHIKESDALLENDEFTDPLPPQAEPRKYTLVYPSILVLVYWHLAALYGLYSIPSVKWATILFNLLIYAAGGFGVGAGTHRLWSHRAYKAKLPLQILLMLFHTTTCQSTILVWAKDHRIHHKYCDTDADPYNSTRGFFYSHMGWLLVRKHPEYIKRTKTIEMSDLLANPVLQFQKKYYPILSGLIVFILPTLIPVYFWQETLSNAHSFSMLRLVIGSHAVFCINSVAHLYGNKPYDKSISPAQYPPLSLFTFGEGYHNYHHVFPNDYRVAELGNYLNFSKNFIDFFAWVGWAYDLKYASEDMITKRSERTGDGTDLFGRMKDNNNNKFNERNKSQAEEGEEESQVKDANVLSDQVNTKERVCAEQRSVPNIGRRD